MSILLSTTVFERAPQISLSLSSNRMFFRPSTILELVNFLALDALALLLAWNSFIKASLLEELKRSSKVSTQVTISSLTSVDLTCKML